MKLQGKRPPTPTRNLLTKARKTKNKVTFSGDKSRLTSHHSSTKSIAEFISHKWQLIVVLLGFQTTHNVLFMNTTSYELALTFGRRNTFMRRVILTKTWTPNAISRLLTCTNVGVSGLQVAALFVVRSYSCHQGNRFEHSDHQLYVKAYKTAFNINLTVLG